MGDPAGPLYTGSLPQTACQWPIRMTGSFCPCGGPAFLGPRPAALLLSYTLRADTVATGIAFFPNARRRVPRGLSPAEPRRCPGLIRDRGHCSFSQSGDQARPPDGAFWAGNRPGILETPRPVLESCPIEMAREEDVANPREAARCMHRPISQVWSLPFEEPPGNDSWGLTEGPPRPAGRSPWLE